ncbi:MAG: hypothetical protein HY816_18655 [Candidatus Wallbacteria bacterium]|nr:hypothetical protein [Candidatus Wallbacteria bacterium]
MRYRIVAAVGLVGLLAGAQALVAQEDLYRDLERDEEQRVGKLDGSTPAGVKLTEDDNDILNLLTRAAADIRKTLQAHARDSKGRLPSAASYAAYETRKDPAGRLMLTGDVFHNAFKGYANKKHPIHEFKVDPGLTTQLGAPLGYVRGALRHASEPTRRLVALLDGIVSALSGAVVRGEEAKWSELPPRAAHVVRLADSELDAYGELVTVYSMHRAFAEAPAGVPDRLREALEYNRTVFGLTADGDRADEARVAAAFARASGGLPPLVATRPQQFTLKADMRQRLVSTLGRPVPADGFTALPERLASMAAKAAAPLTEGVAVSSGWGFDRRARAELVNAVIDSQARLQALANLFERLQVRTKLPR